MTSESHRASEVFESIRALFRKVDPERETVDLNDVILEVLKSIREDLHDHNVIARTELMIRIAHRRRAPESVAASCFQPRP